MLPPGLRWSKRKSSSGLSIDDHRKRDKKRRNTSIQRQLHTSLVALLLVLERVLGDSPSRQNWPRIMRVVKQSFHKLEPYILPVRFLTLTPRGDFDTIGSKVSGECFCSWPPITHVLTISLNSTCFCPLSLASFSLRK